MNTYTLTLLWTARRPFVGGRRPPLFKSFLFIKIESWNLVCILFIQNGIQLYAYVWVRLPQGHQTALARGLRPHFFVHRDRKLKFGINIVRTKFSRMVCIFIWVNSPKDHEVTLASDRRPHFFVYQDRELKFDSPYRLSAGAILEVTRRATSSSARWFGIASIHLLRSSGYFSIDALTVYVYDWPL